MNALLIQKLWHERLLHATAEVASALAHSGVSSVVLKGPTLAERIYKNPAERSCCDVDLLVRRHDLDAAGKVLENLGFSLHLEGLTLPEHRKLEFHTIYRRAGSPAVELHFRWNDTPGPRFEAAAFIERSQAYKTSRGVAVRVLRPEDEVLFLCARAARHRFEDPKWLLDLKLFVLAYPELSWEAVAARARYLGLETILWVSLATLKRGLDFHLPAGNPHPEPNPFMRRLWPRIVPTNSPSIREAIYIAMLFDSLPQACHYLLKRAIRVARRRISLSFRKLTPTPVTDRHARPAPGN